MPKYTLTLIIEGNSPAEVVEATKAKFISAASRKAEDMFTMLDENRQHTTDDPSTYSLASKVDRVAVKVKLDPSGECKTSDAKPLGPDNCPVPPPLEKDRATDLVS